MIHYEQNQRLAKSLIYFGEIILIHFIFRFTIQYQLSKQLIVSPESEFLYDWIFALMLISYLIAVGIRPISFFRRPVHRHDVLNNVTFTTLIMAVSFIVLVTLFKHFDVVKHPRPIFYFFGLQWFAMNIWRLVGRYIVIKLRQRGYNSQSVVLVGGKENIVELFDVLCQPVYGFKVLGYFNEIPVDTFPPELTYLGKASEVLPYLERHHAHRLYCGLPSAQAREIVPIIRYCEHHCIRFFSVPNMRNYLKRPVQFDVFGGVPLLTIHEDPLSNIENRIIKRAFDIVVSGLFLIPFWLIIYPTIAIITKITQPGPVFFKQKRNGLDGKEFYCYKFRSMKVNAQADTLQATEHDPRKTKFGNFLRKSSIDELPQFINVFKGEMSVVGPRPHMVKHTEEYSALIDKYMVRHWVKPGITGWAQVTGARGETKRLSQMEDRIRKDIWYIENWTFLLDIRIIFMTVKNALGGDKQAY